MTTRYKVLVDGQSCHGGQQTWSLPRPMPRENFEPGIWHEIAHDRCLVMCNTGYHLTDDPVKWLMPGCQVYEADGSDPVNIERDKTLHRKVRLLRPVPELIPEWFRRLEAFAASLPTIPFLSATEPGPYTVYDPNVHTDVIAKQNWESREINRILYWPKDERTNYPIVMMRDHLKAVARETITKRGFDGLYVTQLISDMDAFIMVSVIPELLTEVPECLRATARARWTAWCEGHSVVGGTDEPVVVYQPPFVRSFVQFGRLI